MENLVINIGNALGWSIVHSIWQAAIWFILYSVYTISQPQLSARKKHNAAFGTQISIFISFILTFAYFYQSSNQFIDLRNINPEDLRNIMANLNEDGFQIANFLPYVVFAYLLGFLFQVVLLTNSLLKLRKLKFKGLDSIPENWTNLYYQAKLKLDIRQSVGIYLSNKISVPITLGHLRPFILFPIAYANKMELAQVEAILLHELAHVKRQDYLFNLLKVGIETILFFNPFIWALSKVVEREREHACDDMVIEHVSTPISYAQALVELEELRMSLNPALTLAATGNKNHLLKRIKRITKMETNYRNVRPQLLAVLLSGIALVVLALIIPTKEANAQEKQSQNPVEGKNVTVLIDTIKPIEAPVPPVAISPGKTKSNIVYQGQVITDTSELPLDVRNRLRSIEANSKKIEAYYNSPEWKAQIKNIEDQSKKVQMHFDSPEWKAQIKKIEDQSKNVQAYFDSPEWKTQIKNIEDQSKKVGEYFESAEWKARIKKIEEQSKNVQVYFDSPEWKEQIANIEKESANVQKHFESAEWKNQIANIEKESAKIKEHFNSPEWKKHVSKMQEDGKKIQEYFESPEWKEKAKKWKELQDSKEYKEINQKYQKELEELKSKKGLTKI